MDLGRAAYDGFRVSSGELLPEWDHLGQPDRENWRAAADCVAMVQHLARTDSPLPGPRPDVAPRYAIIHVRSGDSGEAWPVVERVRGGWQSGAHHYPDADVLDFRPLVLVALTAPSQG